MVGDAENHLIISGRRGEKEEENYIKINNTDMSAEEVARMIKNEFHL
ncbi:hypothetical protein [Rossellomorea aquimaris]|nr:hypothetical protein [Rossellomorea aquimaris]